MLATVSEKLSAMSSLLHVGDGFGAVVGDVFGLPFSATVSIPSMQLFFSRNAKRIATIFPTRRRNFLGNTVTSHNWSDRTFYETISERAAKFPRISRRCNAKRIPQTTHIINSHIRSANALLELRKVYYYYYYLL